jgi:DNA-binding transcriptional MerR regulator
MERSVGEVARLTGISVRTLHHYDEIGLVSPAARTGAGYRRYTPADLDRLRQVLSYRALGFPLEEIATLLDDPTVDAVGHLRRQHELLTERITRLRAMAAAVERELEAQQLGISLSPQDRFEVFGDQDPEQYADEVEERWGDTTAYAQSKERTGRYSRADWQRIKSEQEDWSRRVVAALRSGVPASGTDAMDLAEEHREQIGRWFYDCGYPMHRGLASMYLADERFTQHYENLSPGLARYLHDAIMANADRAEG